MALPKLPTFRLEEDEGKRFLRLKSRHQKPRLSRFSRVSREIACVRVCVSPTFDSATSECQRITTEGARSSCMKHNFRGISQMNLARALSSWSFQRTREDFAAGAALNMQQFGQRKKGVVGKEGGTDKNQTVYQTSSWHYYWWWCWLVCRSEFSESLNKRKFYLHVVAVHDDDGKNGGMTWRIGVPRGVERCQSHEPGWDSGSWRLAGGGWRRRTLDFSVIFLEECWKNFSLFVLVCLNINKRHVSKFVSLWSPEKVCTQSDCLFQSIQQTQVINPNHTVFFL